MGYALVRLADRFVYWHSAAFDLSVLDSGVAEVGHWLSEPHESKCAGQEKTLVWSTRAGDARHEGAGDLQITAYPFLMEGVEVALLVTTACAEVSATRPPITSDELTGLADRGALEERLAELVQTSGSQQGIALLFVDLDRFKEINDQFGHLVGDEVLAEIGGRLGSLVRGSDFVARFGGDEFVILVEGAQDPLLLDRLVERLRHVIEQPVETSVGTAHVGVSVGIAVSTEGFRSPREWLAAADRRMYDAKRRGRQGDANRDRRPDF